MVRSGFSWSKFVRNVNKVRRQTPHVRIEFRVTVSILNIHVLPELLKALHTECDATVDQFVMHSLQDPPHYRTQVLPRSLKAQIGVSDKQATRLKHQIENAVVFMNARDCSYDLPKFFNYAKTLDKLRNEDTIILLPHLEPYIKRTRPTLTQRVARILSADRTVRS